jgi:hypothetical protein
LSMINLFGVITKFRNFTFSLNFLGHPLKDETPNKLHFLPD